MFLIQKCLKRILNFNHHVENKLANNRYDMI